MKETVQTKERLPLIDTLRGVAVLEMIAYHFLWDLVYLFGFDLPWYRSFGAHLWQQSICWMFILLAGFSWQLGSRHVRRGLLISGGGAAVSLVTAVILPDDRIRWGVLTLIGSCILLWTVLDKVLKYMFPGLGTGVSFVLFLLAKIWTNHDPVQLSPASLQVPGVESAMAYVGFPQPGFASSDYFPLLPWLFLFATGYFLFSCCRENQMTAILRRGNVSPMAWIGRHSLVIYLLHQPVCYAVGWLAAKMCGMG